MPPIKDEQIPTQPVNTSAQIQQIFSEIQSQLPSVNFDTDDQNDDNDLNDADEDMLETNMPENTDALLESLSTNNTHSYQIFHPMTESFQQQPPSVELQMRVSPNLFDNSSQYQPSPPKPSILSMDLFNTIDFDKLPSLTSQHDVPQIANTTRTFNRPRPNHQQNPPLQQPQTINVKSRDDRQILERLAQQANKFSASDRPPIQRDSNLFQNLELALSSNTTYEHLDRHGRKVRIPESDRKTIYIDLRNSTIQKQEKSSQDSQPINMIKPITHHIQSSESESDDEQNDGMLWFEKRQQARKQQQQQQQQLNSPKS